MQSRNAAEAEPKLSLNLFIDVTWKFLTMIRPILVYQIKSTDYSNTHTYMTYLDVSKTYLASLSRICVAPTSSSVTSSTSSLSARSRQYILVRDGNPNPKSESD